jgi:hypothetical protein
MHSITLDVTEHAPATSRSTTNVNAIQGEIDSRATNVPDKRYGTANATAVCRRVDQP